MLTSGPTPTPSHPATTPPPAPRAEAPDPAAAGAVEPSRAIGPGRPVAPSRALLPDSTQAVPAGPGPTPTADPAPAGAVEPAPGSIEPPTQAAGQVPAGAVEPVDSSVPSSRPAGAPGLAPTADPAAAVVDAASGAGGGSAGVAQAVSAGVVAAVVGFAGSFALVLTGLHAVGADSRQAVSALLTLCVAMGLLSAWFAVRHRQPISIAWSTPGAAMLAAVGGHSGGYRYAVGAFAVAGVGYAVSGASERVRRALAAIPPGVATAILAGILLPLCLAPVRAVATMPDLAGPVLVVWALALRWARRWQVPLALLAAIAVVLVERPLPHLTAATVLPQPTFTLPAFSVGALVGLALPLYIVTMASQNVPGLAVLANYGYRPPTRSVLVAGGAATALGAAGGVFSLNLAASTAALMVGPGSHADPRRRWIASLSAGAAYLVFGAAAGMFAVLLGAAPALLFQAVAGLALLGTFASAMTTTLTGSADATAGVAAFLTTASGVSAWQIGSPFWGLLVGLAVHFLLHRAPAPAVTPSAQQPAAPPSAQRPSVPEQLAADRR